MDDIKPGVKTSEFWLTLILNYVTGDAIASSDNIYLQLTSVVVGGAAVIAYILTRCKVKANA